MTQVSIFHPRKFPTIQWLCKPHTQLEKFLRITLISQLDHRYSAALNDGGGDSCSPLDVDDDELDPAESVDAHESCFSWPFLFFPSVASCSASSYVGNADSGLSRGTTYTVTPPPQAADRISRRFCRNPRRP